MNKIPKYVVIIACILVMVVLLPLGYVRYKTRYEAEQISVSTSPDGDYELVIYSVGDPDFPFGAAHGRLVLNGKEKTVAYRSFEVANDGARFYDGDLETTQSPQALLAGDAAGEFIRCHQSFWVNSRAIAGMEHETFCLSDGTRVPISRSYRKDAREAFFRLLAGRTARLDVPEGAADGV